MHISQNKNTYILFVLFALSCEEALKWSNIYCLCFETSYDVYKQTEWKCHLLPVIHSMNFVKTLFQTKICHQLSVVHQVLFDKHHKLHKHKLAYFL